MGLLENLKEKIFGQKSKSPQISDTMGTSQLDLKKFEEEAMNLQGQPKTFPLNEEIKGNVLKDMLQDNTEKLGKKVLEKGKDFKDRAVAFGDLVGEKVEELMQKAEAEAAKETKRKENFFEKAHKKGQEYEAKANDKQRTFQDSLNDAKKSLLQDDFFAKAAKYANSEYGGNQSKPTILKTDSPDKPNSDKGKRDSDDLIEDAIIEK
ncbi:MAG: hypothetical protein RLZZ417_1793 [Bacteroidota bacterium]|jgi:hypothetical protein